LQPGSWYGATSIIVIANTIGVFPFHVLTLHHESYFTFVKFAPLSFNIVVKAGGENFIWRTEGIAQNLSKLPHDTSRLQSPCISRFWLFIHSVRMELRMA